MLRSFHLSIAAVLMSLFVALESRAQHDASAPVDTLDYLLQKDDTSQSWTLGGSDVRPGTDPDGTGAQTWVLTKFSNAACYEVFKITPNQMQCRYEVFRPHPTGSKENWIRRFEAIDGEGAAPGAIWSLRFMTPGGEGFLSRWRQDKFIFDLATRAYILDKSGSPEEMSSWVTVSWATNNWGANNKTGFQLNPVLRRMDEWQTQGRILESYDYAFHKGLVGWRWYERVANLRPLAGDNSGKLFHCENGYVFLASKGNATNAPSVFKYDLQTKYRSATPLEVIRFTSHWRPKLGAQWYVIYRNSVREQPLVKKNERIDPDFSLPEWKMQSNATLASLGYFRTHPTTKP